jgi:hypothetical protein
VNSGVKFVNSGANFVNSVANFVNSGANFVNSGGMRNAAQNIALPYKVGFDQRRHALVAQSYHI